MHNWLRKLEKSAGHNSFALKDGTIHRYSFQESAGQLFSYTVALCTDEDPLPPEPPILQAIRNATDPYRAMEPFRPQSRTDAGAFVDPVLLLQDEDEKLSQSDEDLV
jgi:hypothetical protein